MADEKVKKKKKQPWVHDDLIQQVRDKGKVPLNRTTFREIATEEFIRKRQDKNGVTNVDFIITTVKQYALPIELRRLDEKRKKLVAKMNEKE